MSDHKPELQRSMTVSYREPPLPKSSLVIWIVGLCLLVLLVWAWLFKLEEVSTGTGKVIASSKEQVIQSLEGGILTRLNVKEGDIVEQGQVLAQLDPTRFASNVGESESLLVSAQATAARLRSEVMVRHYHFQKVYVKYRHWFRKKLRSIIQGAAIWNSPCRDLNRHWSWSGRNWL